VRRPRRRSPSDPLPERPEQRSTLRRTAPTAPRRRSAGVGGPGGAQTSAVAGHTEGRQTARTGGGSGARTSAVEGRQTARTGGRSGARTSAIDGPADSAHRGRVRSADLRRRRQADARTGGGSGARTSAVDGPADSAHRGRVRSADLRRRRPGGQRAPGAGQERGPPPSTARRTARTGGGSGARTSAVDGPVDSAHRGQVRSAPLRRRRPGGPRTSAVEGHTEGRQTRAPGAGQERGPPPSTARWSGPKPPSGGSEVPHRRTGVCIRNHRPRR